MFGVGLRETEVIVSGLWPEATGLAWLSKAPGLRLHCDNQARPEAVNHGRLWLGRGIWWDVAGPSECSDIIMLTIYKCMYTGFLSDIRDKTV